MYNFLPKRQFTMGQWRGFLYISGSAYSHALFGRCFFVPLNGLRSAYYPDLTLGWCTIQRGRKILRYVVCVPSEYRFLFSKLTVGF